MPNLLNPAASLALQNSAGSPTYQGATRGTVLAAWAKQKGVYPLLVVGGLIALIALFVVLARMKRDS